MEFTKAIYGMLQSALLFYIKLWRYLKQQGFTRNNYDPFIENSVLNGKQVVVIWNLDDLKISHFKAAGLKKSLDT